MIAKDIVLNKQWLNVHQELGVTPDKSIFIQNKSAGSVYIWPKNMPLTQYPGDAEPIHTPGRAQIAAHLATQGGFEVSTEQVQELFDACDSSEQEPYEALARVGLILVTHTGDINNPEASTGDGVNLNTDNTPMLDEDGT